jgi:hypothetical protein
MVINFYFVTKKVNWIMGKVFLILLLSVVAGCGTESNNTSKALPIKNSETLLQENNQFLILKGAPSWVINGTSFVKLIDDRQFNGVSSASVMGDLALQKATADDNARTESARIFSTFIHKISHGYLVEKKRYVNEEQFLSKIEETIPLITNNTRVVASWREKKSNNIWVSSVLDMKNVKSKVADMSGMDENFKLFFEASADAIFDQLSTENQLPVN